ncbi:unnamed protein product [Lampetra planeri]
MYLADAVRVEESGSYSTGELGAPAKVPVQSPRASGELEQVSQHRCGGAGAACTPPARPPPTPHGSDGTSASTKVTPRAGGYVWVKCGSHGTCGPELDVAPPQLEGGGATTAARPRCAAGVGGGLGRQIRGVRGGTARGGSGGGGGV